MEVIRVLFSHELSIVALFVFLLTSRYTIAYWRTRAKAKAMMAELDLIEDLKKDIQSLTTDYLRELETVRKLSVKLRDFDMIVRERDQLRIEVHILQEDNRTLHEVIQDCDKCKARLEQRLRELAVMRRQLERVAENKNQS